MHDQTHLKFGRFWKAGPEHCDLHRFAEDTLWCAYEKRTKGKQAAPMASKSKPLLHHASQSWGWICKATAPVRVQNWTAPHGTEARPGPSCHCFKWNSLKLSRKMTMSFPPILCFIGAKVATISLLPSAGMMPATWCRLVQNASWARNASDCVPFAPSYAQLIVNAKARMSLPDMLSLHANRCCIYIVWRIEVCKQTLRTKDCFRGLPERGVMVRSGWASTTVISNLCATMTSHACPDKLHKGSTVNFVFNAFLMLYQ